MTREEAVRPFKSLSANWNFLDFTNEATFENWFIALEPYMIEEVMQGVRNAIANVTHTPTVAEVLVYVRDVHEGTRRAAAEAERNRAPAEACLCRKCNDFGFINVIYPNGDEAVRPCSCEKASRMFGQKVLSMLKEPMPKWKQGKLFGANEIPSQYKLVRVSRIAVETNDEFRGIDNKMHKRSTWVYGKYIPKAGREEIFMQYQKVVRK